MNYIKDIFKTIATFFLYPIYRYRIEFKVLSDEETVDRIVKEKLSVCRFGDGEYNIIAGYGTDFQPANKQLACRLYEVLNSNRNDCLVCIPRSFVYTNHLKKESATYWKKFLSIKQSSIIKTTPKKRVFGDASFSRFYMDSKPRPFFEYVDKIRKIWDTRDIYIIEGEKTRFGVGNNLLDNANSVKRILCPSSNAFSCYDVIIKKALELIPNYSVVLVALGMTATVLAFDLSNINKTLQVIDIGHLDIEYEWLIRNCHNKQGIPGKAVNEVHQNNPQQDIMDSKYSSTIIETIENA